MKKYYLFILLFMILFQTTAQQSARIDKSVINVKNQDAQTIQFDSPVTSISFNLPDNQSFGKFWVVVEDEEILVKSDDHEPTKSQLVVFSEPISSLKIRSESFMGDLIMNKIFVKPLILSDVVTKSARIYADCEKPTVIPASVWRSGLTPPKELPTKTTVKHIIVHHAAGSNTNINYTDVVRNIYTFHTGTNGWNDVGYNFLISQDGTIYEGRDGQNIMDGDNVQGAHFCSQNGGTMGICLLGDYMTVQPNDKSLESLSRLIAWKMKKETLQPLEKGVHTISGNTLNNISAHRDGTCATNCPGDNLYPKLEQIRQKTIQSCDFFKPLAFEDDLDLLPKIYPNPTNNRVWVNIPNPKTELYLFDGMGREVSIDRQEEKDNRSYSFSTEKFSKGVYFLKIGERTSKLIIE